MQPASVPPLSPRAAALRAHAAFVPGQVVSAPAAVPAQMLRPQPAVEPGGGQGGEEDREDPDGELHLDFATDVRRLVFEPEVECEREGGLASDGAELIVASDPGG